MLSACICTIANLAAPCHLICSDLMFCIYVYETQTALTHEHTRVAKFCTARSREMLCSANMPTLSRPLNQIESRPSSKQSIWLYSSSLSNLTELTALSITPPR